MFVRLLAVLISNILCSFNVLVCCRSLVQISDQKGEIEQMWKLDPWQCDRAHCTRAQGTRSSASTWTHVSHVALAAIAHSLTLWDFWGSYLRSIAYCAIECNAVERNTSDQTYTKLTRICNWTHIIGSNACGTAIDRTTCDRAHPWPGSTLNFVYK